MIEACCPPLISLKVHKYERVDVKVLLVAQDEAIRAAMIERFELRRRPYVCADLVLLEDQQAVRQLLQSNAVELVFCGVHGNSELNDTTISQAAELANACAQQDIPLIQLSSARIFDGCEGEPFGEEELPVPLSREAVLVARLEELVRGSCEKYIILRTGDFFGASGDNALTRLFGQFREGQGVACADQGLAGPVHIDDLSRVVSAIIDQISCAAEVWGTYHYYSSDPVSHFHFAETVLAVASQYLDVSDLQVQAMEGELDVRWASPQLNCNKLMGTFGIKQQPWRAYIVPAIQALQAK
jgi:dTDP-4-dehydrorhamnose reductase